MTEGGMGKGGKGKLMYGDGKVQEMKGGRSGGITKTWKKNKR